MATPSGLRCLAIPVLTPSLRASHLSKVDLCCGEEVTVAVGVLWGLEKPGFLELLYFIFLKEGINFSLSLGFKMLFFAFSALPFKRKHLSVEKRNDNYRLKIVSILI